MRRLGEFWRSLRGWQKVFWGGGGAILFLFIFFVFSFEALHYTESTQFCSTCHAVMEPEVVAHRVSAHANVTCADCHIGPGIEWKFYYKAMAVRYLWTLPLQLYKRPIPTARDTMRSTDEICEQCHSTENFEATILRTNYEYATDENNTFSRVLLALKVGNGIDKVPEPGHGAHWHVQHPVKFVGADEFNQEIPWVQTEKNGETVTYVASDADPALYANAESEARTMDCIDCHSRAGHPVNNPADVVDDAMANDRIPADLPYVKAQTMAVLDQRYTSKEEALAAIDANLRNFYQTEYPDVYSARQADVDRTVAQVQKIFADTAFPYMNVYWDTYPNNTGHINTPGCWRCHNGNLLSEQGAAIAPSCNLCHGLPQEAKEGEALPVLSFGDGELPESHQSSLWIAEHRFRFDATCDDCHTVADPGGISNSSFCSNSGCHARDWNYLKIDTPAVLALTVPQDQPAERRPPHIPHPLVEEMNCDNCHALEKPLAYPEDHTDYSQSECTDCHRIAPDVLAELEAEGAAPPPAEAAPPPTPTTVPSITHSLVNNEDCLACHAVTSNVAPAPMTHSTFTNEQCQDCHTLAPGFEAVEVVVPTAAPTLAPEATAVVTTTVAPTQTATLTATTTTTTTAAEPTSAPLTATEAVTTSTPVTSAAAPSPTATEAITTSTSVTSAAAPSPTVAAASVVTATTAASPLLILSHGLAGNENCVACHSVNSTISPAPASHAAFTNEQCTDCHQFEQ